LYARSKDLGRGQGRKIPRRAVKKP